VPFLGHSKGNHVIRIFEWKLVSSSYFAEKPPEWDLARGDIWLKDLNKDVGIAAEAQT
jgi:hypothetical protein